MKHNTRPGKVERMVYLTILVSVIPFFKKTGCGNARRSLFTFLYKRVDSSSSENRRQNLQKIHWSYLCSSKGFILGVGAKMFTIAGPVIVYGLSASVVYGFIYWLWMLFA